MQKPALLSPSELAQYIDHTCLRPDATEADIRKLCEEAIEYRFKAVCVEAKWLPIVSKLLANSGVLLCTVVAFPSGAGTADAKRKEAKLAVDSGAQEVDMVLNRAYLADQNYRALFEEIAVVVEASKPRTVKVILETSELNDTEKTLACGIAKAAGAHFVKTSTGFSASGASVEDVALMRRVVGPNTGVKASGGIRTLATALQMILAGASRLGTSASVALVRSLAEARS